MLLACFGMLVICRCYVWGVFGMFCFVCVCFDMLLVCVGYGLVCCWCVVGVFWCVVGRLFGMCWYVVVMF